MLASAGASVELTPRQREAVAHRGRNLLLEAVPGSGKTRVIVERCASLLADGIAPSEILLLTFSRRAVAQLRGRLALLLPPETVPEIRTFHGFAARLLADAGNAGRSRRLLSEPAERVLFETVVATTPLTAGVGDSPRFRDAAAVCVAELRRSSDAALARLRENSTPRIADLLDLHLAQTVLRERIGVADYDDLVARAVTLASTSGSAVAHALNGRYRHVLVDEFQDTDALQLALIERLGGEIFAVGDAAQAIYGFRGAARNALTNAKTELNMTTLTLDESFRCPADVCALAASVWPSLPDLHSRISSPGEVEFRRAASPQDEAALLGDAIAAAIDGGTPEHEIAVLVRSAEPLSHLVQRELRSRGIAVAPHGGEDVLEDLVVDAIRAALEALANPAQGERWLHVFAHPVLGIEPLALRLAFDAQLPDSIDDACALAAGLHARARVSGERLATALRSAQAYWDAGDPVRAARSFAAGADVLGFVIAGDENEAVRSGRRIVRFLDALGDVRDVRARLHLDSSSAAVLSAFLAGAHAWRSGGEGVDEEPGVRILTIHAAKGLEFAFVAIADAVDGHFPQRRRADALLSPAELDIARACGVDLGTRAAEHDAEERSLWYVAVTRTKRKLLVTWSESELDGSPQRASRFIPLEARSRELQRPSFRGQLTYSRATEVADPQMPTAARLGHPLGTSTIETWLTCRRKFYYSALLRVANEQRGFKAKLGTLVHRAIERFHATVRDLREVPDGAHVAWTAMLHECARAIITADPSFASFDSLLETQAAVRAADRLLRRYARELETSARASVGGFEVVASEEPVRYAIARIAFSGKIDRIDRRPDGSLTLIDVKTSAFKKEKAMAEAFPKIGVAATDGTLWIKPTPPANPQLALYRHAKLETRALQYVYLDARPKPDEFIDAAHTDRLDVVTGAVALAAIDTALSETFFVPWTTGSVTSLEPTRNARTCRFCEFVSVCPGFIEDDE